MIIFNENCPFDKEYSQLFINGFITEQDYLIGRRQYYRMINSGEIHPCQMPQVKPLKIQSFLGKIQDAFLFLPNLCLLILKKL